MYEVAPEFQEASVETGTNLLVSGPPLSGKRRLALSILAHGTNKGEGAIVVTTKDNAKRILTEYESLLGSAAVDTTNLGIVDCVTKQHGTVDFIDDDRIRYVSSPVDMTGIGIDISELLKEFYVERKIQQNRILLYSLSTLLMYSNLQTVFRFLHVFTGRVQSADALGIYVIDSTAHDDQTLNTLKQLFDGIVEVSEEGGVQPSIRLGSTT